MKGEGAGKKQWTGVVYSLFVLHMGLEFTEQLGKVRLRRNSISCHSLQKKKKIETGAIFTEVVFR